MDNQVSKSGSIQFQYDNQANWLNDLATAIKTNNGEVANIIGNTLLFPPATGTGNVRHWNIGDNISVSCWDSIFTQPFEFISEQTGQYYSICCFFTYEHLPAGEDRSFTVFYDTAPVALSQAINDRNKIKAVWFSVRKTYFDELLHRQANTEERKLFDLQLFSRKTLINKDILVALDEFSHLVNNQKADDLSLKGKIFHLLSLFLDLYTRKNHDKKRYLTDVERLLALNRSMEEKCFEDLMTVPEMAEALHISVTKFKQLFSEVYNNTYLQYHIYHRLLVAQQMLRQPKIRMGEIALKAGYSGVSHFTKAYRKHFGNSPADYHNEYMRLTESIL